MSYADELPSYAASGAEAIVLTLVAVVAVLVSAVQWLWGAGAGGWENNQYAICRAEGPLSVRIPSPTVGLLGWSSPRDHCHQHRHHHHHHHLFFPRQHLLSSSLSPLCPSNTPSHRRTTHHHQQQQGRDVCTRWEGRENGFQPLHDYLHHHLLSPHPTHSHHAHALPMPVACMMLVMLVVGWGV